MTSPFYHQNAQPSNDAAYRPVTIGIGRGPGGVAPLKADWSITLPGICVDAPFRHQQLFDYRKFCEVIERRYGVVLGAMEQEDWVAVVLSAAIDGVP